MKLEYKSLKLEKQCTDIKAAKKLFGGNNDLAISLLARIRALTEAVTIKDIIVQKPFRFHKLNGKREGQFAIDAKTKRDAWRIILEPLDESGARYVPCNIDEISMNVRIVEIVEVSKHYE